MNLRLRTFLGPRARSFAATVCLLAASLQLAVPVLHGAHGGHGGGFHAQDPVAGSLRAGAATTTDADARHEGSTCLQCRLVSQLGSLAVATTSAGSPPVQESRVHELLVDLPNPTRSAGHAPPRAPPLFA